MSKKLQFKIGDLVIIKRSNIENLLPLAGKMGTVINRSNSNDSYPYLVDIPGRGTAWCEVECLVEDRPKDKIVITTDGVTITATLYAKDGIRNGIAKCSPDDEFDFETGAKLAMSRLYPEKSKGLAFVPHLEFIGYNYGNIGKKTNYKDAIGRELYVGDVVEHYDEHNNYRGDAVVVRSEVHGKPKTFIMGIEQICDESTGSTGGRKLILKQSANEVKDGETIGCVTYVLKQK